MEIDNPLESCRVLLVENEKDVKAFLTPFLAPRVKTLWVVENAKKALAFCEKERPDIVVTSYALPGMDGIRLARRLHAEWPDLPVLLMATYSDRHSLVETIEAGISVFLRKPIKLNELLRALESAAEKIVNERARRRVQATMAQHYLAIEDEALLIYLDEKGRIRKVNDRMALLLHYPLDLLEGEPFESLLHKDDTFHRYDTLFRAIDAGDSWHGEVHLVSQFDMEMIFKATMIPLYDTENAAPKFMLLLEDITELVKYRKILKNELDETQKSLQEKIHFLEQYQKAINEGTAICRFLEDGTILKTDKRFDTIFGFEPEKPIHRSFYDLCPDDESSLRDEVSRAIRERKIVRRRVMCRERERRLRVADSVFIPIYRLDGAIEEIISIHNDITDIYKLNEEIKTTQKELLYILGEVAESRSRETGNHVKRVAEYTRLLAQLAGLDDKDVEMIHVVAPMHDVGKIAIPDEILLKEGPLSPEEFEIMKRHAQIGGELFGHSSRPFMKAARIVASEHHENYDGSGYPVGKRGEDIHIFGRIVAIADVFDALSMDRIYKRRWSDEEIVAFMRRERGKKFDPHLIDLFLEHIDLFFYIRKRLGD